MVRDGLFGPLIAYLGVVPLIALAIGSLLLAQDVEGDEEDRAGHAEDSPIGR